MSEPLRLLDLGGVTAPRSQALYHGLARAMTAETPDTLVLCRPTDTCFCVGHHQEAEAELDLDFCRHHRYPVLRRGIGGGAVLLDRDQLFYQALTHASRAPLRVDAIYRTFLAAPVAALRALGLPARLEAANEIEVGGRRIAGTGGGRIGEAVVVTGNLLFDFPYALMTRAWRVPTEEFRRLAGEALRRSVTTLRRELERTPAMAEVTALLRHAYQETLRRPLLPGELTLDETRAVDEAEEELLAPAPEEPVIGPRPALKIARGVYVRQLRDGPALGPEPGPASPEARV